MMLLVSAPALAVEDDFLDDEAPCFEHDTPPELLGPLRAPGTHRACLRTEAAVTGRVAAPGPSYGATAFFSWRSRKRAEAFAVFEQPGPLRLGIAWQTPFEPRKLALGFNLQALLPTFGAQRRAGGSLAAEWIYGFKRGAFYLHAAVTPAFYEQDDGRWLFGAAFDATPGLTFAPWRFLSFSLELRVTAGHQAELRGAMGARYTMRFLYVELVGLTPAVGTPRGFEGALMLAVQPFEHVMWPRVRRREYDDDLAMAASSRRW